MIHRNSLPLLVVVILLTACTGPKATVSNLEADKPLIEALPEEKRQEFQYLFVEALKQKMIGNTQRAVSLLSSCLEIDPNSAAAMFELANLHVVNSDLPSAVMLLERATEINPTNLWYWKLLAEIYAELGRFGEAAGLYQKLSALDPGNPEFIYYMAVMYSSSGNYDAAISAFDQLEREIGVNEQISLSRGQLHSAAGLDHLALQEIYRLIEMNPADARYYGLLADAYLERNDRENALLNYQRVLELDPDNGFVHFSLSNFYLTGGDSDKAFEHLEKAFQSRNAEMESKLQLYLMQTSNRDAAPLSNDKVERLVQLLIETHPEDYRGYTLYAELLLSSRQLEAAREKLYAVIDLGINDFMVWEQILFIDNELLDWDALYHHTRQTIELYPNQPQLYFFHAIATLQLELYDETKAIADEGLLYVVDNPSMSGQLTYIKGEAYYKQQQRARAYELFDESLVIFPDNFMALNNYAYYLALDGHNLDKAERMSAKVVERFPDNPTYLDTYAWVLFKKGNYTLARFYMQSAIDKGGAENPVLLEHFGDILSKMDRTDEAVTFWQRALDNGSDSELLPRKIRERVYIPEIAK